MPRDRQTRAGQSPPQGKPDHRRRLKYRELELFYYYIFYYANGHMQC
jgi:hypothetical protein